MRRLISKRTRYEAFVVAHTDELGRFAFSIAGDRAVAEDAVQEALASVYQRWSRIRDPLAYARRAIVNAIHYDWRRRGRVDRAYEQTARLSAGEAHEPHDRLLVNEALMAALDALPVRQRAVIVLRYGSQLSEAETAATLGISVGTVKSQTARAFARLRILLGPAEQLDYEREYA